MRCFIHISYATNLQRRGKWVRDTTRQRKQMGHEHEWKSKTSHRLWWHKHEWRSKISHRLWRELTNGMWSWVGNLRSHTTCGGNPGFVLARQATHQATSPAPHTYLLLFRLAENQNRSFSYWWRYEKLDSLYQVSAFALQRTCRGVNTRRVTAGRQHTNYCMSLLSTNEKLPRDIFLQVHNVWLRTLWLEPLWCSGFLKWPYGYITRHSRGPECSTI